MQESALATCEDCGKNYRVPSADRSYSCKACGGTVRVPEADGSPQHTADRPSRRARRGGHTDAKGQERPRLKRRRSHWGLIVWSAMGVVLLVGVGWMLSGDTEAGARKGEPDLGKVIAGFDIAWNEGDLDVLLMLLHPDKRLEYDGRLRKARKNRGWEDGHTPVIGTTKPQDETVMNPNSVVQKDGAKIQTGVSMHETKDGMVICRWQFNAATETWYVYQLEIPSPDLPGRLDGFEQAWNAGDEPALRQYLDPSKADKLIFAFARAAEKRSWDKVYPEVAGREIESTTVGGPGGLGFTLTYGRTAKVNYDTEHGTLMVRWKMLPEEDAWFVNSFDPPE